ncbi:MAG: dTMP kinase [Pseudomonadota bacterium]
MRGVFITVEGIDGSGKTTQAHRLAAALREAGHMVRETREPGGSPGAEQIRQLLVTGAPGRWSADTEVLLFTAARRDHVETVIRPALAAGEIVVCDRYVDSTRVYQGGTPERRAAIDALHASYVGLDPDLTLVFEIEPTLALSRLADRAVSAGEDRFEQRGAAFQHAIAERFAAIAAEEPARVLRINAGDAVEAVAARALSAVVDRIDAGQATARG